MGLISSFLGKDQQRDIQAANAEASKALQTGYDSAYGDYTSAIDSFKPYVESGQQYSSMYDDLMGLNGPEARAKAQAIIESDPQFTGQLGASSNAMLRQLNATGDSGGGKAALAGARVLNETYGSWLDRYRTGKDAGFNATNAMAGYTTGRGDLSMGYGATKANQATQYGNAMASSRNIGVNNILGAVSTAVNAFKPTPTIKFGD